MMDHQLARKLLERSLTGGLAEEARAELERHLERCDDCRGWAADLRLFARAQAESKHPSSDLLARHAVDPELLPPSERAALGAHTEGCPECRRELGLTRNALAGARRGRGPVGRLGRVLPRAGAPALRWAMAAALILAAALAFNLKQAPVTDAASDQVLFAQTVQGRRVVDVPGSITARAVAIETGAEVLFRAGESVTLSNGFSVAEGASLTVVNAAPVDSQGLSTTQAMKKGDRS